ncbi:hypothetical protein TTHERM_00725910 (macronuclear) [Tetrahymena thermophila SB210]|uniref:Uncharacterized protein n=1 Tax=Tetrahymena thermophila (strain SB210) TaxID=312017 RepID=Q24GJ9_TETTS|nr:hypothetical protein TTHERM_00725910 [Tetrahymena thermophila SB210]EAS06872.2 hypothetical protein TTHERM_00725910 [Tetrahymena thermophila SB210]|eukprot:XP_001027114.2 hypothetical protein TTHERM_00725910 [Tetrahymena thermophila SB210]
MLQGWNQFNYPTKINNYSCQNIENQIGEISLIQDDQVKRSCQNQLNCLQFKDNSLCSSNQIEEINFLAQRLGISTEFPDQYSQYGADQQYCQNQIPEFQKENIEMKMNFIDKIHQSLVNYNLNAPIFYYQNSDNIVLNLNQNNSMQNTQNKINSTHTDYLNEGLSVYDQQLYKNNLDNSNTSNKNIIKSKEKKRKSSKNNFQKKKDKKVIEEFQDSSKTCKNQHRCQEKQDHHQIISKEDKENINLCQSVLVDSALMPIKGILKQDKKFVTFQKQYPISPQTKSYDYGIQSCKFFQKDQYQQNSQETSSNSSNDNQYDQPSFAQEQSRISENNNSSKLSNSSILQRKHSSAQKNQKISEIDDLNQTKCKRIQRIIQTPNQNKNIQNSYLNLSCEEKQRELSINQVKLSPLQKSFMSQTISSELRKSDKKQSCSKERSKSRNSSQSKSKSRNNSQNEYQQRRVSKNNIIQEEDKKSQYYQSKWLIDTTNKSKQSKNDIDMINKLYEKAISSKGKPLQTQQKNFIEDNKNNISNVSQRRNQHKNWDEIIKKEFNITNRQSSSKQKNLLNESSSSASFFQNYVYKDQIQSDHYKKKYANN